MTFLGGQSESRPVSGLETGSGPHVQEEFPRIEVRYLEQEWVAAYVLPSLMAYHQRAHEQGRALQVFVRTVSWPADDKALQTFSAWVAGQPGHPDLREVLTDPAWEKPVEAYFQQNVLKPARQGFREILTDLHSKRDNFEAPIALRPLLRYIAENQLEIRAAEPDSAWKIQQRQHLAEEASGSVTRAESVTKAREHLREHVDLQEQIERALMTAFDRQRQEWPTNGALRVELTLSPPGLYWPPAHAQADIPLYEVLRARLENRAFSPEVEDLRLLQPPPLRRSIGPSLNSTTTFPNAP